MTDMGPEEARGFYFNKTYAKIENLLIPSTTAMSEYAYGPQVGNGARGVGLVVSICHKGSEGRNEGLCGEEKTGIYRKINTYSERAILWISI